MARLWTCGFELQSATALMEVLSVTGTPSISTTVHRGGGASLRSNPTAATAYVEQQLDASGVNGRSFHRLYLYIATLPSATCTIYAVGQSGYFPVALQLTTGGALQLRDTFNSANAGTASAALTTGVWYQLELDVSESGATGTTRAVVGYLDGIIFSGTAVIAGSTGYSRVRAGVQTSASADIHIDDIAVNNPSGSSQTGLPGPGRVVHLRPTGAGDNNGWATAVGGTAGAANNYTRVSDATTPDDATTYNETTAVGTATIDDYAVSSPTTAGIGADDTINVVHVGGRIGSDAATAASIVYRLKSQAAGTVIESATVSVAIAGWRTHKAAMPYIPQLTSYADPQTGTAWTRARLSTAQIGVRGDVSQATVRRVSALWATVEYQPRTVVQLGAAREASSAKLVLRIGLATGGLQDDFTDGTVDSTKWPESYGGVTETGGRARVPCTTDYAAYASAKNYRLTGSEVGCLLYPAAGGGAIAEAWSQVLITTTTAGTDATIEVDSVAGLLAMAVRVGYADPDFLTITYDPVAHAWVRIREAAGSLYWETSPDGSTWTVRRTATSPAWVSDINLQMQLIAHRDGGTDDYAEFDSFNLFPTVQTIQVGAAAETSGGRAVAVSKRTVVGASHGAETAQPLVVSRTTSLAPARTADTARPLSVARRVHLGAAHEVIATQPVASARALPLGVAGMATAAAPLTGSKRVLLGAARSGDGATQLHAAGALTVSSALTADAALPLGLVKVRSLGTAGVHANGQLLGMVRTAQAGAAEVSQAGLPVTAAKVAPVPAAQEYARAGALAAAKRIVLGAAVEQTTGQPLTAARTLQAAGSLTVDAAAAVTVTRAVRLGAARVRDAAYTPAPLGAVVLGAANTRETARPVTIGRMLPIGAALQSAAAAGVTGTKAAALLAAHEAASVRAVASEKATPADTAGETSKSRPIGPVKTARLGTARVTERARPLPITATAHMSTGRCAMAGRPITVGKIVRRGAAHCASQARSVAVRHGIPLGTAIVAHRAPRVRQPFQTRMIRTARCAVRAGALVAARQRPADTLTPSASGPTLTPSTSGPALATATSGPQLTATVTIGG